MIRANDLASVGAGVANYGEMVFGIDQISRRACFEIPRPNTSFDFISPTHEKAATFVRRFVTRVGQHIGDGLFRNHHCQLGGTGRVEE